MNTFNIESIVEIIKCLGASAVAVAIMGLTTTFLLRAATLVARAARTTPYAAPTAAAIPPPKVDTPLQLKAKWDKANERFNSVLEQWQAFELDAAAVLWERPQLADVSSCTDRGR